MTNSAFAYKNDERYGINSQASIEAPKLMFFSIFWGSGNVHIKSWDGDTIEIKETKNPKTKDTDQDLTMHYYFDGDTSLYIQYRNTITNMIGKNKMHKLFNHNKDLQILVPKDLNIFIFNLGGYSTNYDIQDMTISNLRNTFVYKANINVVNSQIGSVFLRTYASSVTIDRDKNEIGGSLELSLMGDYF